MLLAYNVLPYAQRLLATPTLMVVAEGDDHTHWDLAAQAFGAIPGQRKRLHIVPKSTHLTLYEDEGEVGRVAAVVSSWFAEQI
jgi:uncharacterized protein